MSEVTTDHETIREWAQRRGGKPAAQELLWQLRQSGIDG